MPQVPRCAAQEGALPLHHAAKLNADELMSWYTGETGDPTVSIEPYVTNPKLLPSVDHVPRKPQPIGKEIKAVADGQSGMMQRLEFQRGKHEHKKQPYFADYGHTIAQSVRLTEPWHDSKRRYDADSWFGGVTAGETLDEKGAPPPSTCLLHRYMYICTCTCTCTYSYLLT